MSRSAVAQAGGSVDWAAPWLAPYRAAGQPVLDAVHAGAALADALRTAGPGDARPHFVAQRLLPVGTSYERYVHDTGRVPVRDNLHDFFNGLVWLHFPRTKARLSALHASELARLGAGPRRGPLRDALTVFDENGALLLAPRGVWDALRARDWHGLFVADRAAWAGARLLVFGHGLLEQLQTPRKPLTAHVYPAPTGLGSLDAIDDWLAQAVGGPDWPARPFAPLPVLGVPGWCAENEHESFYDDAPVFRRAGRSDVREQRTLTRAA